MRLEARDIVAGYGGEEVLKGVSLDLGAGEFVGLIGPNGCGKSTLLRALTNTLRPLKGLVWLDGVKIVDLPSQGIARKMAFVPQQEPAAFDFTVRDVVLMGRYPYRRPFHGETTRDYALVEQALGEADILHLADRPITQLSGGEHRRVLLARALAQQTPLLLLDEPTAHLDVTHQAELLTLMQQQTRERNMGVLAALHDLNQAAEFCDRLILMSAGIVIDQGSPQLVLTPDNLRIAYDARARIGRNPATGRPMILTLQSARGESDLPEAPRIHVICGGGTGGALLAALVRAGYQVSAGVLNALDSDHEAGQILGVQLATEAPFSAISSASREEGARLIAQAQTVIITPVPFGTGNLINLELALEAQAAGKEILLIGDSDFTARDYTGGGALRLLESLLRNGMTRIERMEDWPGLTHRPAATTNTVPIGVP